MPEPDSTEQLLSTLPGCAGTKLSQMLDDIKTLVNTDTPSEDKEAVAHGAAIVADMVEHRLGVRPESVVIDGTLHLRLRFGSLANAGGAAGAPPVRVLLANHQDTVWPHGTAARKPFTNADGRLTGPGTFDMLTGLVMSITAVQLLQENVPGKPLDGLTVLITGDEEVGSPTSSQFIIDEARGARAAFVLEASATGPQGPGALKVGRKGTSMYTVKIHGRAAHAGLEPERGINAGLELAHLLPEVAALSETDLGTTVTPTRLSGGTTTNTVPADAQFDVDVRAKTAAEQERVDTGLRSLEASAEGASIAIEGGINRPPLERKMTDGLFARAQALSEQLGLQAPVSVEVGGASDGNFTAAAGVPTLDGLGAVGDGAHAEHEHALVDYIVPRTGLLAALIADQLWDD